MYIYKSHMGGLYTDDEYFDLDDLYCEACNDYDWYLGRADTAAEAWDLLKDKPLGYSLGYITKFIKENFDEE